MEWFNALWDFESSAVANWITVTIISLLSILGWIFIGLIVQQIRRGVCFFRSRQRALAAVARVRRGPTIREGDGAWVVRPVIKPDQYEANVGASRILAIANLKGGVGKTTIAANIAAFLAKEWNKRVLLVDLDYQATLSSMALPGEAWLPEAGQDALAVKLLSGDISADAVAQSAVEVWPRTGVSGSGKLKIITAHYELAQTDTRLFVEWLLHCKKRWPGSAKEATIELLKGGLFRATDVRYGLADVLHAEPVRKAFDLIIIDCPPRLTTGTVQALCASSHILIPTIFDKPSAEAVISFCEQIESLKRQSICPHLKHVGVVGTKVGPGELTLAQRAARQRIEDDLKKRQLGTGLTPPKAFVPHTQQLLKELDEGIAYLAMTDTQAQQRVRAAIEALAVYVAGQVGVPAPTSFHSA